MLQKMLDIGYCIQSGWPIFSQLYKNNKIFLNYNTYRITRWYAINHQMLLSSIQAAITVHRIFINSVLSLCKTFVFVLDMHIEFTRVKRIPT